MAAIVLPNSLARLFPGCPTNSTIDGAESVAEVIERLESQWPGMRDRLRDSTGAIREHLKIFVDGERADLETSVAARSEVLVIPAISGGACESEWWRG